MLEVLTTKAEQIPFIGPESRTAGCLYAFIPQTAEPYKKEETENDELR